MPMFCCGGKGLLQGMISQPTSSTSSRANAAINHQTLITQRFDVDVNDRYEKGRVKGTGTYGSVFVARDRKFHNRRVAVKRTQKDIQRRCVRLEREQAIMKELDHPNICKLFETYEEGSHTFLVMEYCDGGDVLDRLSRIGRFRDDAASDVARQVACGLRYAHERLIAHRDIKAENVVFCTDDVEDNRVKLIDWGLGCFFGAHPEASVMKSQVGSAMYIAPEVITASRTNGYTCKCDIWSLGVLAYVMLQGRFPFEKQKTMQEQLKVLQRGRYELSNISPIATTFIRRLLRTNPRRRPHAEAVMALEWVAPKVAQVDDKVVQEVLNNIESSNNDELLASICAASVARQLDHQALQAAHRVFCEMDLNGDGVLSMDEVHEGFKRLVGKGNASADDPSAFFRRLDLDGSGAIEYTEFCAAGVNAETLVQVDSLWAAFKTFDLDNDGNVSKREVEQILENLGLNPASTAEQWQAIHKKLHPSLSRTESDAASLCFSDWVHVATESLSRGRSRGSSLSSAETMSTITNPPTLLTNKGSRRNSSTASQACAKFALKQPAVVVEQ